jgi:hypothetical protein
MARGWESKAVESQIEAAEARQALQSTVRTTPEQLSNQREVESLQLSRTRVTQDLSSAQNPNYRKYLERSLEYLDEKLRTLEQTD